MTLKNQCLRAISIFSALALLITLGSSLHAGTDSDEAVRTVSGLVLEATRFAEHERVYGVSETGLYIIRFDQPSLASYTGGFPGLRATSPEATGERRLNARSPASLAYVQYLTEMQNRFAADLNRRLSRSVSVVHNFTGALNGMAVTASHEEALQIADMPGVAAVYADTLRELTTDVGPLLISAPAIWNGNTGPGVATRGEGIIIGILDTGINSQHPSFAATDGDGYTHTNPYGAGVYRGWCATNPGFCNGKLVGAYTFHPNGGSPEDTNGHGSHTAGTAGGNAHIATFNVGNETYNLPVQGVAPRANIVAYKVCDPSCPTSASVAAINSAILNDQVDVINYSISGGDSPWTDPVDLAFLDASNAGIYVAASAGNAGPGPSTVAKTGPWNAATAASTHNRAIGQTLDVTSQSGPIELQGLFVVPGEGTSIVADINSGIRYDATNNLGCDPFAAGTFTDNLALIQRGGCTFATKATNARNAGATGVVLFQSVGGPPITAGGNPAPPAVMMDLESGIALRDHILVNPNDTTVRINAGTSLVYIDEWEDIVGGFSSRGPSQYEILKPDFIAPGVNILAAVAAASGGPIQYGFLQGTSMSSPHGAGAAALMMALHPTWSPAAIRSALATTAVNGLFKEDGLTPADPFDVGSGRLDLSLASTVGLVFDETGANYAAADPALGGDPKTLNQPSVVSYNCAGTCTWTRTVTSTLPVSADYTAAFSGPAAMNVTVTPSAFTIAAGGTQVLTIEADVAALPPGNFGFGSITLSTNAVWPIHSAEVADTNIPVVVFPVLAQPLITVAPDQLSASQVPDTQTTQTLTIGNLGGLDLDWSFSDATIETTVAVWDQPVNGSSGIVSDFFIGSNAGAYSASDFMLSETTGIAYIFAAGFDNFNTLSAQPAINWAIYADNGGVPAGHPEDGTSMASALWVYTAPVIGPGVDITGNNIALDLIAAGEALSLDAGTYWLTVYPSYNVTGAGGARWNWYQAAQVGAQTQLISPGIFGVANWTSLGALGVNFADTAFRIEAPRVIACEHPNDLPWLSAFPTLGTTGQFETTEVVITFNSTGLAPGDYSALLCISSNDADTPLIEVPVLLEVLPLPSIEVDIDRIDATQEPDTQTTQDMVISNTGNAGLDWFIEESEGFVTGRAAGSVLYDNGPFITSFGNGPGGSDVSLLQNVSLGLTTFGGGVQFVSPGPHNRIADEFEVTTPGGWTIDNIVFYGYQTGSTTASSFTGVNYRIWDGPPNDPTSSVVFGDTTTNRFESADWTGAYRYTENNIGTTRPVMQIVADAGLHLEPGTYWIDWQLAGTIASGPWQPPITILGQAVTGNAIQMVSTGWQSFLDTGTGTQQGAPFQLWGGTVCSNPSDVSWISVDPVSGTTMPGNTSVVEVTLDSTGVPAGNYTAYLCLNSNDPGNPVIVLPVTLEVFQPGELTLNPPAIDFAAVQIGQSETRTLTVTNEAATGARDLTIASIGLGGDAGFAITGGSCSLGTTLAPQDAGCTVEVSFQPTFVGNFDATLTVTTSDAQSVQTALSGEGIPLPPEKIEINAGNGQSATTGTAVAIAPSVLVTDANNDPVEGVSVRFAVTGGGGSVTGEVAMTNASGIATVGSWILGTTAGINTLTATSGTLTNSPVTFTATGTTVPAAPMDVFATARNTEATVFWTAPTDDGGLAITGYTVTGNPGGSCSVEGSVAECTITGLTNGISYTFTVVATNDEGDSPPSEPSNAVTPSERVFQDRFEGQSAPPPE